MSLWFCMEHGLYGPDALCPRCGKAGQYAEVVEQNINVLFTCAKCNGRIEENQRYLYIEPHINLMFVGGNLKELALCKGCAPPELWRLVWGDDDKIHD